MSHDYLINPPISDNLIDELNSGNCPQIFKDIALREYNRHIDDRLSESTTLNVEVIELSGGWRLTWSKTLQHVGFVVFRTGNSLKMYVASYELCPVCRLAFRDEKNGTTKHEGSSEIYAFDLVCSRCGYTTTESVMGF